MFNNFEEVTANHWFATTDVDVKHLQRCKFIKNGFRLFSGQFAVIALSTTGQAMHARQVACVGQFPCKTDGGIKSLLHLLAKAMRGHELSPMW